MYKLHIFLRTLTLTYSFEVAPPYKEEEREKNEKKIRSKLPVCPPSIYRVALELLEENENRKQLFGLCAYVERTAKE